MKIQISAIYPSELNLDKSTAVVAFESIHNRIEENIRFKSFFAPLS